jgi:hypothetical protein
MGGKSKMRGGSRMRKIWNWTKKAVASGASKVGQFGLTVAKDPRVQKFVLDALVQRMTQKAPAVGGRYRRRKVVKKI